MPRKAIKNKKRATGQVSRRSASVAGMDHDFIIIAGGGFLLIILILLVLYR